MVPIQPTPAESSMAGFGGQPLATHIRRHFARSSPISNHADRITKVLSPPAVVSPLLWLFHGHHLWGVFFEHGLVRLRCLEAIFILGLLGQIEAGGAPDQEAQAYSDAALWL